MPRGTPWYSKWYCVVLDGYSKVLVSERADGKGSTAHKQPSRIQQNNNRNSHCKTHARRGKGPNPSKPNKQTLKDNPKANKQTNKHTHTRPNQTHKRANERTDEKKNGRSNK